MADINQIVRLCVCAVIILTCVRIISGNSINFPHSLPCIEDNSYLADVQVVQYFDTALEMFSHLYYECLGLIIGGGCEAISITQ